MDNVLLFEVLILSSVQPFRTILGPMSSTLLRAEMAMTSAMASLFEFQQQIQLSMSPSPSSL